MNWIYTWYNPRVDANAEELSRGMGDIFLRGISSERQRSNTKKTHKKRSVSN
jgi:hypothetical protein